MGSVLLVLFRGTPSLLELVYLIPLRFGNFVRERCVRLVPLSVGSALPGYSFLPIGNFATSDIARPPARGRTRRVKGEARSEYGKTVISVKVQSECRTGRIAASQSGHRRQSISSLII